MPLFRRQPPERRQWTAEPIIPPFPGATVYGDVDASDPGNALRVPAVWACVRLKADAVSGMAVHRYKENPDGSLRRLPSNAPGGELLLKPSADRTLPEWLFDIVVSSELRGNVFGRIMSHDSDGRPNQIELVNPDTVKLRILDDGSLEYRFGGVVIPRDEVWHLRGFSFPGSPIGLSTIAYGAQTIGLAAYAERFGSQFFRDGAHPSAVLTTDQIVDQAGAQTIKDRFRAAVQGREPVVLGHGVAYSQISVNPDEAQFLATQQFSVAQIARLFGVPAAKIGGETGGSMTYANVEQLSIDFLVYGVQPLLRRIEVALSALLPDGEIVRFDVSTLLRTDAETRAKVQAIQIASKTRTPDEQRIEDGLLPLTEEQLKVLELIPLEVTPTGMPKIAPPGNQPDSTADPNAPTPNPAPASNDSGSRTWDRMVEAEELRLRTELARAEAERMKTEREAKAREHEAREAEKAREHEARESEKARQHEAERTAHEARARLAEATAASREAEARIAASRVELSHTELRRIEATSTRVKTVTRNQDGDIEHVTEEVVAA